MGDSGLPGVADSRLPGGGATAAVELNQRVPGIWVLAGTAVAYLLAGLSVLLLCRLVGGPGSIVAPVYPAAGLALAAALVFGPRAIAGVFVGAVLVSFGVGFMHGMDSRILLILAPMMGLGAALQAAVGAAVVFKLAPPPLLLDTPREILRAGLPVVLLVSFINASVATAVLWTLGLLPEASLVSHGWAWWLADATGVAVGAPLVLSWIGSPRAHWRPRQRVVALPLLMALGLLLAGSLGFARLEQRSDTAFVERDFDRVVAAARQQLNAAQHPMSSLSALLGARQSSLPQPGAAFSGTPNAEQFARSMQVLWTQNVPALSAGVALLHTPAAAVSSPPGGPAQAASAPQQEATAASTQVSIDDERLSVLHRWPPQGGPVSVGLDLLSVPGLREPALRALRSGQPTASAAVSLPGAAPNLQASPLVFIMRSAPMVGPDATQAALQQPRASALAFVALSPQQLLDSLQLAADSELNGCLLDVAGTGSARRLAGKPGCELAPTSSAPLPSGRLQHHSTLQLADRELLLLLDAPVGAALNHDFSRWLAPAAGLVATSLLGVLLLTMTGQARRTEAAVLSGTAELRREMRVRTRVEDELRTSEARLRAIHENLPVGVVYLDREGYILDCNPRMCGMLGQSSERLRGRVITSCFDPADQERLLAMRRQLVQGRPMVDSVEPVGLLSAPTRVLGVRVFASALHDAQGEMVRMLVVAEDMSEHQRLLASEQALSEAQSASQAKSEFVSRMSHELRTPLNAMIGFAQLLSLDKETALVPHQQQWSQQIQRAGWHLLAMINDTLDLARIESGATRLSLEAVEISPLLQACCELVQEQATRSQVKLSCVVDPGTPAVLADGTRLKQVLLNLLTNGIKYNREGGSLALRARAAADEAGQQQVLLEVIDTGLGMNAHQLASLFQPYNRLGRERSGIEGTGIGLVISRKLAQLMGGTLQVQSKPHEGSTVSLRLPAAHGSSGASTAVDTEQLAARYQQRLVHYVEDNATNLEVMRGVLLQRSQITLQSSTLGLDGLSAIRHSRPDLILLDMQLPDISGLELLRHIKLDEQIASIPVIVVSADATPQNIEKALTLGALHYVTKPLDIRDFLVKVDDVLNGGDSRM